MPSPRTREPDIAPPPLRAALAQMCSADTHAANIATVTRLAEQAAGAGAELLALPEVAGADEPRRDPGEAQVVDAAC